ncbi:MAG: domain S-box [Bacteroidetes bacterium]|nr:domain S-box [Bacteroidota bacterium]
MSLSRKTKEELIAEVKKLQRKVEQLTKKAVQPAKQDKKKWDSVFKHSANTVIVIDKGFKVLDINRVAKGGWTKKTVLGRSAYDFGSEESKPVIKKALSIVFKTAKSQQYIISSLSPKGETAYFSCKASPLLEDKKVIAVIVEATDITKEIVAQNKLKQNEEKFRMLAQNAADILYRYKISPTYECEYISPSVKEITGYSPEEYYRDPFLGTKIIHPDDRENAINLERNISKKPIIARWIRKDGKVIWTETSSKPIYDKKGKLIAIEGIGRDITERKRAEEKLKHSEENLSQVLNNIKELVYYVEFLPERNRQVKYLGRQIESLFGITKKEYEEDLKILVKLCHPDDVGKVLEAVQKVKDNLKPQKFTYRFLHREKGEYVWLEEHVTPQIDEKGKHVGNFGITRDVTEHINAEQKLKKSEERFRMLAENAMDVIYRYTIVPEARYEYVSPSLFKMSGYTPEDFYRDPYIAFKIIHPDDLYLLGDSEETLKKENRISSVKDPEIVLRWIKKDGSVIWTATRTQNIYDKDGNKIAVEGISRDVTHQKQSEEQLRDSEERFKILSNATFEGIVFSESGKIIDANDQFVKMYGYDSVQEVIGKDMIEDFIVEDQKAMAFKFLRLPKSDPYEVQTIRKDGTLITVETKAQNIPYFGKTIRATVIYNITDRKEYEFNLRESERKLSTLMNNLPGMAYRCDKDSEWTMEFVSEGCFELTGYLPKDLIGNHKKSFAGIVLPEDKNVGKEQIRQAIKNKTFFEIEYRIITAKGETKWVWEKGEGVFSESGELLFLEGFISDVTHKKEYELEITRSRENYKSLVDYSPDGVFIHIDGKVVFANPSALKLAGMAAVPEDITYSLYDFLLPEYKEKITQRIESAMNGKPQDFIELKIRSLDGEIREVETKPILIKFNGKNAVLTVVHDISTQKQLVKEQMRAQIAEETNELLEQEITKRKVIQLQLQESQKYTRLIINGSIDMICASDKQGFITEFNAAAQRTFGYTSQEVIGKHMSMLFENAEQRITITDDELYRKGAYAGEVYNVRKNGELFTSFLSASILKNEEGEIIGAMGVSRDISEVKKAEERLYAQSAKLNAVFESSSHMIWTVDRNIDLTSYNKNHAIFLKKNYGVNVYIGISMVSGETVSTKEYNSFWIKKYESAFKGDPQHFETKFVDPNARTVWREIFLNPIYDELNNVVGVSGIGHDVTEKKFAEEKIRQSLKEKEVLLKEVHHRVKNNLQVISSILNLQSSYVKDPGTLNILKESQNRIKSMAFIHESLYQTKDFSSINFSEYVVNLSQNLIQSYSNFENEIKLNLDIQNVFLNLDLAIPCGLIINEIISNALKYAFVDKKDDCEITIQMVLKDESLVLFIADNGIGLPKEIDYRNTQSLGLQLVVTLTDQLNGNIEMNSDNGTKYTIIFKQNQVKNRI